MPWPVNRNPSYRKHKSSKQAVVTLNGDDVYLGPYGTQASRDEYDRVITEWHARGRQGGAGGGRDVYVADLIKAYYHHAERYYKGGQECKSIRLAKVPPAAASASQSWGMLRCRSTRVRETSADAAGPPGFSSQCDLSAAAP